jgi:hypothetical protein
MAVEVELKHGIIGSSGGASPLLAAPVWEMPAGEMPVSSVDASMSFFGIELIDSMADPFDAEVKVREQQFELWGSAASRTKEEASWSHTDGYDYIVTATLVARWVVSPLYYPPGEDFFPPSGPSWTGGGIANEPKITMQIQWYLSRRLSSTSFAHAIYNNLGLTTLSLVEPADGRTAIEHGQAWSGVSGWEISGAGSNFDFLDLSASIGEPFRPGRCVPRTETPNGWSG